MTDKRDTLPAPHPDTPEWALKLYDIMLRGYQELVMAGRKRDAVTDTTLADHEHRLRALERPSNGWSDDVPTNPGGE